MTAREIALVDAKAAFIMQERGFQVYSNPVVQPSFIEKIYLEVQNRLYRIRFRISRFGFLLVLQDFIARKMKLKNLERACKERQNEITKKYINKDIARQPRCPACYKRSKKSPFPTKARHKDIFPSTKQAIVYFFPAKINSRISRINPSSANGPAGCMVKVSRISSQRSSMTPTCVSSSATRTPSRVAKRLAVDT